MQSFPKPRNSVTVSTGGASQPRWRRDGKELFFVTLDGMLMAAPIKAGGRELQVGEPKQFFRMPVRLTANHYTYDVVADGQRFLITTPSDAGRPETLKVMLNWKAALTGK